MMRTLMLLALLAAALVRPAIAADYALILNDAEKVALIGALDEATKAKGLAIANDTLFLANKIKAAPLVTERKDDPVKPDAKP